MCTWICVCRFGGWAAEGSNHHCPGFGCPCWGSNSLRHWVLWQCPQATLEGYPSAQRKGVYWHSFHEFSGRWGGFDNTEAIKNVRWFKLAEKYTLRKSQFLEYYEYFEEEGSANKCKVWKRKGKKEDYLSSHVQFMCHVSKLQKFGDDTHASIQHRGSLVYFCCLR